MSGSMHMHGRALHVWKTLFLSQKQIAPGHISYKIARTSSEDPDQPGHPHSLPGKQGGLSLPLGHIQSCRKCFAPTQLQKCRTRCMHAQQHASVWSCAM